MSTAEQQVPPDFKAPHPLAGQGVWIAPRVDGCGIAESVKRNGYVVEDWWIRVAGKSWMDMRGNPGCMQYATPVRLGNLPVDDRVIYGHADGLGYLVHESEIAGRMA